MKHLACLLAVAALALAGSVGAATDTPMEFADPAQEAQYEYLINELRCLVCQNQSLADSHAELAQDLRDQVASMLRAGKSRGDIIEYMVARYGDFVLYRPPLKPGTVLLWGAPLLFLGIIALTLRRRGGAAITTPPLDPEEQTRLDALVRERSEDRPAS